VTNSVRTVNKAKKKGGSGTWSAPDVDWIKVNVDASYVKELGNCSLGCIARDHEGNVLWACNQSNINAKRLFKRKSERADWGFRP
jgi:isoaspartyl peptidase/L-asparaginase-like protein (Ntn-hydrolase superfamily)